jgi:hypothetical protein
LINTRLDWETKGEQLLSAELTMIIEELQLLVQDKLQVELKEEKLINQDKDLIHLLQELQEEALITIFDKFNLDTILLTLLDQLFLNNLMLVIIQELHHLISVVMLVMEEAKPLVTIQLDNNHLVEHLKTKVDMKQEDFLVQDIVQVELAHLELLDLVQDQEQDHQDSLLLMEQETSDQILLEQVTIKTNQPQVQDINLTNLVETQALLMFQEHPPIIQVVVTLNSTNHMVEIKDQVLTTPTNQEDNDLFIFIKL